MATLIARRWHGRGQTTHSKILIWLLLSFAAAGAPIARGYDRTVSIGGTPYDPQLASTERTDPQRFLVDLVRAMDRATHSSSRIVERPFARSLRETADGLADIHIPLIQSDLAPPPDGLVYVMEVDFGRIPFTVYSRKTDPLDANTVLKGRVVETEPGHEAFFPFPVGLTHCLRCTLEKILLGRTDALIVPSELADPLLSDPKYKGIHRALYANYPVRALVPAKGDTRAARRYLIDGVTRLRASGELWKITHHDTGYVDWQP
jgi:hypothetical protein